MVARASSRMTVSWTQEKSRDVSYRATSSIAGLDSPRDKYNRVWEGEMEWAENMTQEQGT